MQKEYVFDVTGTAQVKARVAIEAESQLEAEKRLQHAIDTGDVEWKYDGYLDDLGYEHTLR